MNFACRNWQSAFWKDLQAIDIDLHHIHISFRAFFIVTGIHWCYVSYHRAEPPTHIQKVQRSRFLIDHSKWMRLASDQLSFKINMTIFFYPPHSVKRCLEINSSSSLVNWQKSIVNNFYLSLCIFFFCMCEKRTQFTNIFWSNAVCSRCKWKMHLNGTK